MLLLSCERDKAKGQFRSKSQHALLKHANFLAVIWQPWSVLRLGTGLQAFQQKPAHFKLCLNIKIRMFLVMFSSESRRLKRRGG